MVEKIEEENYEFDFSRYEQEEKVENEIKIFNLYRPRISNIKSRFSNGEASLNRLAELDTLMSRYSIDIGCYVQDINKIKRFYAILNEYWENIYNIVGQNLIDEVHMIKKRCNYLVNKKYDTVIPNKVHNNLLFYRKALYRLRQFLNLGFEIENRRNSVFSQAKDSIVE